MESKAFLCVRRQCWPNAIPIQYTIPFQSVKDAWEGLGKWMGPETVYIELRDLTTGESFSWNGGKRR